MSPDLPAQMVTDARRLRQILMNLVGNAVKFTDRGEVTVSLRVDDEGRTLVADVTDTGIGLSDADQQRLFSAFVQTDAGRGGVGLGLVLARQLSRQLGGDLALVSSRPSQGSRFRLQLAIASNGDRPPAAAPATPAPDLAGLSVLLAEDHIDILEPVLAAARVGRAAAWRRRPTASRRSRAPRRAPFDVVLMDMQMPVLDGLEATVRLRQPGYTGPILALSAHAMPEDRQRFLDAGCNDHIAKPIDFDQLLVRLDGYRLTG